MDDNQQNMNGVSPKQHIVVLNERHYPTLFCGEQVL